MAELSAQAIADQAATFLSFEERSGFDRAEAWRRWAMSKDFDPADAALIAAAVRRERVVRSVARSAKEPVA